jgi:DNA polymerase
MSDDLDLNPEETARQLRRHLESLRASGVEWVPVHSEPPAEEAAPAIQQASLFTFASTLPDDATSEKRLQELVVLSECVGNCTRCPQLASTRTQTVFGVGPLDPELCFVGEAPGADEDAQGVPFVGAAGQLLNRIIAACGMKREEVYVCNILRCRPPGNRTPTAIEAANCREYLDRQLELVRPRYICALGACAAQNLLGTSVSIGKLRGRFYDYKGIPVLCTYHPSYLLRATTTEPKRAVWDDMKTLLTRMGKPIPQSGKKE